METKKRLSKVLDAKEIVESNHNKFCIISGVGSGKNYFVENILKEYGNILYISSRRAKVDEILVNKLCNSNAKWEKEFGDVTVLTNSGIELLVKNQYFNKSFTHILNHYDFVVVDEAHSLFNDATYTDSSFHVHSFINYISKYYVNIKIILMTGTPEPIPESYLEDYIIINKMDECINVVPKEIKLITKEKAIKLIENLPDNEKTIYYSNFASKLVKGKNCLCNKLTKSGKLNNSEIAFCMSKTSILKYKNEIDKLAEKVNHLREYIQKHNKLPKDKKVLLTTATLKEGVNIKYIDNEDIEHNKINKREKIIKIAFCESHLLSEIQQFAGRIRDGLEILYIIEDAEQHEIKDSDLKIGCLEFNYDKNSLLNATNNYLDEYIKQEDSEVYKELNYNAGLSFFQNFFYNDDYSLYFLGGDGSKSFINLIEDRNRYIKFNHLTSQFDLYENKLVEQKRVNHTLSGNIWEKELSVFAKKYGISYVSSSNQKEIVINELNEILVNAEGLPMFDEDRASFRKILREKLGLDSNCSDTTINRALIGLGIKYYVESVSTTKNKKKVRYLLVKKAKNLKTELNAKELKWYIYKNDKIEYILKKIGNHTIRYHKEKNYYSCANYNGDNTTAVNILNNEYLSVRNWTRPNEFRSNSDIFTLIQYNLNCDFKTALKYLHSILGLSGKKIWEIDFSSIIENELDNNEKNFDESQELIPMDECVLNKYIPMLYTEWYKERIMPWTREKFDIRYSYEENKIIIPIRKWNDGTLVALNKRTVLKHYNEFGIPKYQLSKGYKKNLNVYGFWEHKKDIEEKGYCVLFEGEKSTLIRDSLNDPTGLSLHGKSISNKQVQIILSLNIEEVIIALDEDVPLDEVRFMASKFYGKLKVSYIYDKWNLLSPKQAPADAANKEYLYLFENRILFDEEEYFSYLESLNKK